MVRTEPTRGLILPISRGPILSPWLGDIVDSGIGLSCWPANLCSLLGWYDNPMPESTISPQSGTQDLATELCLMECNRMSLPGS
jgi:hypothetical protein